MLKIRAGLFIGAMRIFGAWTDKFTGCTLLVVLLLLDDPSI